MEERHTPHQMKYVLKQLFLHKEESIFYLFKQCRTKYMKYLEPMVLDYSLHCQSEYPHADHCTLPSNDRGNCDLCLVPYPWGTHDSTHNFHPHSQQMQNHFLKRNMASAYILHTCKNIENPYPRSIFKPTITFHIQIFRHTIHMPERLKINERVGSYHGSRLNPNSSQKEKKRNSILLSSLYRFSNIKPLFVSHYF